MGLVREGRVGAFEALYDRHHKGILSFCRHMLSDADEAEDAVQHTFMAAYRELADSDKPIPPARVAVHGCPQPLLLDHPGAARAAVRLDRRGCDRGARRPRSSVARICAIWSPICADCPTNSAPRWFWRSSTRYPTRTSRRARGSARQGQGLGLPGSRVAGRDRTARDTACSEIREQLASGRGAVLRRANLRRHLRECDGCREFRAQVETQRRQFAVLLPVLPAAALKEGLFGGAGLVIGGTAAVGGGAVAATALKTGVAKGSARRGGRERRNGRHAGDDRQRHAGQVLRPRDRARGSEVRSDIPSDPATASPGKTDPRHLDTSSRDPELPSDQGGQAGSRDSLRGGGQTGAPARADGARRASAGTTHPSQPRRGRAGRAGYSGSGRARCSDDRSARGSADCSGDRGPGGQARGPRSPTGEPCEHPGRDAARRDTDARSRGGRARDDPDAAVHRSAGHGDAGYGDAGYGNPGAHRAAGGRFAADSGGSVNTDPRDLGGIADAGILSGGHPVAGLAIADRADGVIALGGRRQ